MDIERKLREVTQKVTVQGVAKVMIKKVGEKGEPVLFTLKDVDPVDAKTVATRFASS